MANCLVTGANRGIGLALCRQLAARGERVVGVCRRASHELRATGVRVVEGVDVSDPQGIESLAAAVEGSEIDLLVNNAGIARRQELGGIVGGALDDVLLQFRVNAVGPVLVTQALLGNLRAGSKVGIVTSRMGSVADNGSGGHYGYRMSKAAVNAAGKSLAVDLRERGIAVALLHPGYVATDMTDGRGEVDPADAARGLLARLDELTLETTGGFWHANGQRLPW